MATFLSASLSPDSRHIFSFNKSSAKGDITSLSGASVSNSFTTLPETYLPETNQSANMYSKPALSSRPSSYASSTKSHLRQSNHHLYEMLQSSRAELAAYRSILLDIQARVSHLEQSKAATSRNTLNTQASQMIRTTHMTRESQAWWEACQNFAANCDTPFSADEFLKTTRRFSGFDFNLDVARTRSHTAHVTPGVEDVPGLIPGSSGDKPSDGSGMPNGQKDVRDEEEHVPITTSPSGSATDPKPSTLNNNDPRNNEKNTTIINRILSFSKLKPLSPAPTPASRSTSPPTQLSPPRIVREERSKSFSLHSADEDEDADITALPKIPLSAALALEMPTAEESPDKSYKGKGLRRVLTYRTLLRGR